MSARVLAALLLGTTAVVPVPALAEGEGDADDGRAAPVPPQAEVVGATTRSLTLHVPKWKPSEQQQNIGLDVHYRWTEDAPLRAAKVRDAGTYWIAVFPDRPEAGKKVDLEYVYRFRVTDAARSRLVTTTQQAIEAALDAAGDSLLAGDEARVSATQAGKSEAESLSAGDAARETRLAERFESQLRPVLMRMQVFTAADGESADVIVLRQLGFQQTAAEPWTLDPAALGPLSALEGTLQSERTARAAVQALPPLDPVPAGAQDPCRGAVEAAHAEPGVKVGLAVVEQCGRAIATLVPADAAAIGILTRAAEQFGADDFDDLDALNGAATNLRGTFGPLGGVAAQPGAYARLAFGVNALIAGKTTELKQRAIAALTATIIEERLTLTQSQPAEAVLVLGATRRWYDAVTGIVYVAGLDDVILPTMIALCPAGCLKVDEGTADYASVHSWSFDLGVKAATLDADVDARHDGQLGLLFGASWNPIDVARLSLGGYAFENAQSDRWNLTFYGGVTFNVLHAGELLGLFGVSEVPKATITPKP